MSWQFSLGANVVGKCPITGPKIGMVLARVESICGNRSYEVHSNGKSQLFPERDIELVDEGIAPKLMKAREETTLAIIDEALWDFQLGECVILTLSGERGTVGGRTEYDDGSRRYYVRYLRAGEHGETQCEGWFTKKELAKQEFVLISENVLTFDQDLWRRIVARWETGGRKPLSDDDLKTLIELSTKSNR